ncbi:fimbrial protein [Paraburkholderia xenovorans]|uniref:fimbrial protein n=1 Tax=Paraburkholderia xenovorans TaxID=36873 RepID=UPI0038BDFE4E
MFMLTLSQRGCCPRVIWCRRQADRSHDFVYHGAFSLKRFFAYGMLALIVSLVSMSANARLVCSATVSDQNLAVGTVAVPSNASAGSTITTLAPTTFPLSCAFNTTGTQSTSTTFQLYLPTGASTVAGYTDVFLTNVSGIGIRYSVSSAKCNIANKVLNNTSGGYIFDCGTLTGVIGGAAITVDITLTASFVVTGKIAPGVVSLSSVPPVRLGYFSSDGGLGSQLSGFAYSGSASGTFMGATCSVSQPALTVQLPTVSTLALSSGVGTVTGPIAVPLSLNCTSGAKVWITLTDNVNPANTGNTLQLSSDSTAQGVGIQILNGSGAPVSFGADSAAVGNKNQWLIGDSPNGLLSVPLTARYISKGIVTAGTVKALATFTMSYQ